MGNWILSVNLIWSLVCGWSEWFGACVVRRLAVEGGVRVSGVLLVVKKQRQHALLLLSLSFVKYPSWRSTLFPPNKHHLPGSIHVLIADWDHLPSFLENAVENIIFLLK